jgi:hypothetical protein
MRKAAAKSHSRARSVLVALALALGILAPLLLYSGAKADPPTFNVTYSIAVEGNSLHGQNGQLHHVYNLGDNPWPAAFHANQVTFIPPEWGMARSTDVPIGAIVGKLVSTSTVGWFNNPCSSPLPIDFDPLMNCSTNTAVTVNFAQQFGDTNTNGIPDGCDKYPAFLNTMFPGITPREHFAAFETTGGSNLSVNFLLLEPGTDITLPGVPDFPADYGYLSVSVINDPTGPLVANQITDLCPPLSTHTYDYSPTVDNTNTAADESGYAWRTNPATSGIYTFRCWANSIPDADDDDIDNKLDTCPHIVNAGDPRVGGSGDADSDGLDDVCDPNDADGVADPDGDLFPNFQDNCPLVSNASQADGDYDGIGDACDKDDWNNDGDILDPGEPTGFSPTVSNGDVAEVWITQDVTSAVGGLAELPDVSGSSSPNYIALAGVAAAALVALSASAWYARRRWIR